MFRHVLVPVDMTHIDQLGRALEVAGDLARRYGAGITYVGVTGSAPAPGARTPEAYRTALEEFASAQGAAHGVTTHAKAIVVPDPSVETDRTLRHAVEEVGADLVVMASHVPNVSDYVWPSHGGSLASHAQASVFLVRPET